MTTDERRGALYASPNHLPLLSPADKRKNIKAYTEAEVSYYYSVIDERAHVGEFVQGNRIADLERQFRLGILPEQEGRKPALEALCTQRDECPCPSHRFLAEFKTQRGWVEEDSL